MKHQPKKTHCFRSLFPMPHGISQQGVEDVIHRSNERCVAIGTAHIQEHIVVGRGDGKVGGRVVRIRFGIIRRSLLA